MSDTGTIHMGTRGRKILISLTLAMLCVHVIAIVKFGSAQAGEFLSDFVQMAFGLMLVPLALRAANRSTGVGRHYWRLTALAYSLWDVAQILATVQDIARTAHHMQLIGFLFYFWYVPIGMALFLDPESDSISLDRSAFVDLIQGLLFLVTAYVYFFLISAGTQAVTGREKEMRDAKPRRRSPAAASTSAPCSPESSLRRRVSRLPRIGVKRAAGKMRMS